jgi:uncharacterized protein (TIGR00369 family)
MESIAAAWGDERHLDVSWNDPKPPLSIVQTMRGVDYLRAIASGAVPAPPIAKLLGMDIESVEEGTVAFGLEPHESHYNPIGVVHGGIVCTMLDTVLGCAVHSTLEPGWAYTSVDLNVTYLRPITLATGRIIATGTIVKGGKRVSFASAEVRDAAGALLATGTSSLLMMPPAGS